MKRAVRYARAMLAGRKLGVVCVALCALSGCKDKSAPPPGEDSPKKSSAIVIGMSQCNLGEPWRVQMNADIERAAKAHPSVRLVMKDAQNDSLRQRAQVEELAAEHVDVLIISPKEAAPLTKPVARVFDSGIPVIVLDRAVLGDAYTTFIGADNVKIGRAAGEWVRKTLNGTGKIVELEGLMTSTPGQDRHKGFLAGLEREKNPGLEMVDAGIHSRWTRLNAGEAMEIRNGASEAVTLEFPHSLIPNQTIQPGKSVAVIFEKAGIHQIRAQRTDWRSVLVIAERGGYVTEP